MDDQHLRPRTEHPTYLREQRQVASKLIALLVSKGVPPEEAVRKAMKMIDDVVERDRSSEDAA